MPGNMRAVWMLCFLHVLAAILYAVTQACTLAGERFGSRCGTMHNSSCLARLDLLQSGWGARALSPQLAECMCSYMQGPCCCSGLSVGSTAVPQLKW
jgi:hypothetical protein